MIMDDEIKLTMKLNCLYIHNITDIFCTLKTFYVQLITRIIN